MVAELIFTFPVEIDYGAADLPDEEMMEVKKDKNSKLSKPLQDLICLIFDINTMKKTLYELEYDLDKMPLGMISQQQIRKGKQEKCFKFVKLSNTSRLQCFEGIARFIGGKRES